MKLAQLYQNGHVSLALIEGNDLMPTKYPGDMMSFIENGGKIEKTGEVLSIAHVKLAPPVLNPSKIIALGLNYKDHAKESKGEVPKEPLVFAKFANSLSGPNDEIFWEKSLTSKVDFEAELAVIIGKKVKHCSEKDAMNAIFGYTCANDVSARDLQFGDGQWVRGKSLDSFCPLGPWLVTSDEIADPHNLRITSKLNGTVMQKSNTRMLIFDIPFIINFLSKNFTLLPGDIILTGTPEGVGAFREPPVYMKDGDEIIVEIEGIGRLKNICRAR